MAVNYRALPLLTGKPFLNFNVVGGTTEPTNPKENTIWINTDTPISYWSLSSKPLRKSNNKNLLCPCLDSKTITTNTGITITDNWNGTFTANGTNASDNPVFVKISTMTLSAGTYTLSRNVDVNVIAGVVLWGSYLSSGESIGTVEASNTIPVRTFTLIEDAEISVHLGFANNVSVSDLIIKPQLEKGSEATDFVAGGTSGQVWIQTLNSDSLVSFNALKTNQIDTNLTAAYQWIDSEWMAQDAFIYSNGAWVQFDAKPIANAIETFSWAGIGDHQPAVLEDNTLKFSATRDDTATISVRSVCITENAINMTGFSSIRFYFSSTPTDINSLTGISVGIADPQTGNFVMHEAMSGNTMPAPGESLYNDITIDVSSVVGEYCIRVDLWTMLYNQTVSATLDLVSLK